MEIECGEGKGASDGGDDGELEHGGASRELGAGDADRLGLRDLRCGDPEVLPATERHRATVVAVRALQAEDRGRRAVERLCV